MIKLVNGVSKAELDPAIVLLGQYTVVSRPQEGKASFGSQHLTTLLIMEHMLNIYEGTSC